MSLTVCCNVCCRRWVSLRSQTSSSTCWTVWRCCVCTENACITPGKISLCSWPTFRRRYSSPGTIITARYCKSPWLGMWLSHMCMLSSWCTVDMLHKSVVIIQYNCFLSYNKNVHLNTIKQCTKIYKVTILHRLKCTRIIKTNRYHFTTRSH